MAGLLDAVIRAAAKPAAKPGIRVYHSSPYDFDRFDMSRLRTGQGSNSYGEGLYFAESPKVSGQGGEYWNEFLRHFPDRGAERQAAELLQRHGFDRAKALKDEELNLNINQGPVSADKYHQELYKLRQDTKRMLESNPIIGPRTYEVNINARPDQFLDWDKPLAGQPAFNAMPSLAEGAQAEAYSRALASTNRKRADELWSMVKSPETATGEFAYRQLSKKHGDDYGINPKASVADAMRDAGIPGIRYLDQNSRAVAHDIEHARRTADMMRQRAGGANSADAWAETHEKLKGVPLTHNYVVNNDALLDIMKKYSLPGMMGMTGVGAASGKFAPYFPQQGSQ